MKICTRIGVFRMISTYPTVSWLTTGMRRARAAPSTRPITNEPAIATRETLIVLTRPSSSSRQFSDTNAHRSYTASVMGRGWAVTASPRPPPGLVRLRAHSVEAGEARRPVLEVLVWSQAVLQERRHEARRDVAADDRREEILLLHEVEPRIHPPLELDVPLFDADAVRLLQEQIV